MTLEACAPGGGLRPTAPDWLREIESVQVLRNAWVQQYHRDEKGVLRREGN
ncbi:MULTISPECIES: hypothetical protein [unclassified Streptomyces]|uniref:hypothetical protein n=1 Tax=unclassified Streptomyces TaxID=2593676 RepID=UPI002E8128B5|nr:hypothetical protein [Streptomyces sp. NBC_00562]WUC24002.1 hypothetical protein OHA33_37040 [Streptomyces sp. NBC_00562]